MSSLFPSHRRTIVEKLLTGKRHGEREREDGDSRGVRIRGTGLISSYWASKAGSGRVDELARRFARRSVSELSGPSSARRRTSPCSQLYALLS